MATLTLTGMDASGLFGIARPGDVIILPKIAGAGAPPTITLGSGAGAGSPSYVIDGTDIAGNISVTTGANALSTVASATIFNMAFATSPGVAPKAAIVTPANSASAALSGSGTAFADLASFSSTGFNMKSGLSALVTGTTYKWHYNIYW